MEKKKSNEDLPPKLQIKIFGMVQIIISYWKIREKGDEEGRKEGEDKGREEGESKEQRKEGRKEKLVGEIL